MFRVSDFLCFDLGLQGFCLFAWFFFSSRMLYGPWLSCSSSKVFLFFFFSLKSFSIKPNSPSSPLYCLCILHLFHDCYGNMSVVYILYFVSCELYKVKGQVMPIFIPHNKQWLSDFIKHKNHPSSLLNSRVPDSITRAPDTKI